MKCSLHPHFALTHCLNKIWKNVTMVLKCVSFVILFMALCNCPAPSLSHLFWGIMCTYLLLSVKDHL